MEDADELKVTLGDRREFDGKVVGTDPQTDVAVVKIEGRTCLPQNWVIQTLFGLGNGLLPLGILLVYHKQFLLVLSAPLGRVNVGVAQYEDLIQTDAAINPGIAEVLWLIYEGVIGINTAIYTRSGGYQGVGFAIPINMVKLL